MMIKSGLPVLLWSVCCLGSLVGWSEVLPKAVRGVVKATRLNARLKPSITGDVVCQLNKGEVVRIREVAGEWLGIEIPTKTNGWIPASAVNGNVVRTKSVVRIGPGKLFTAFAIMEAGAQVQVLEKHGDWVQVSGKMEGRLWIHRDYVAIGGLAPVEQKTGQGLGKTLGSKQKQSQSPTQRSSEVVVDTGLPQLPDNEKIAERSKYKIFLMDKTLPPMTALKAFGPPRSVKREGVMIRIDDKTSKKARYALAVLIDKVFYPMLYVYGDEARLKALLWHRVNVKGELQWFEGLSQPVISVSEITSLEIGE
ncbi:MAG: hypothetical protein D6820_09220 [Lentisphaerae bacterium]|nr:MAG: hypothetical protein D6820_09220 [Lentisphaerota bacterium]